MRSTLLGAATLTVAATLALTQLAPASADSIGVRDPKDLDHGADLNWVGYDHLTPLDAAARSDAAELVDWLRRRGALSATAGGGGVHPGAGA